VTQFKRGNFSTRDAPRSGRPKTKTTPEIIDKIHHLILEHRRISAKSIAEQLGNLYIYGFLAEDGGPRSAHSCFTSQYPTTK